MYFAVVLSRTVDPQRRVTFTDLSKLFNLSPGCIQHRATHIHHSDVNAKRSENAQVVCVNFMEDEEKPSLSIANFIPKSQNFMLKLRDSGSQV
jgi:hypothetical protein